MGMTDDLDGLWPDAVPEHYRDDPAGYRDALLEQYKLYVEMADRVSHRRGVANSFFLTLNTALASAVGLWWQRNPSIDVGWLVFPLVLALLVCGAWFYLVRSYRQLNTAKWRVVGAMEERLPASPWYRAEWAALGEGRDRSRYWPLSHVEQWVPILFAVVYVAGFGVVLVT